MANHAGRLRRALGRGVVLAQRYPGARQAIRGLCRIGIWRAGRRLQRLPSVEAVYVRHSHPASGSFVAGASDLDVTLVLDEGAADEPEILSRITAEVERMERVHFYLEPRDLRFTTRAELDGADRNAPFELLYKVDDWVLLAGTEVRGRSEADFPSRFVPWHPEFGKWWHHILQDHLLASRADGPSWRYLRPVFRDVVKQKMQFLAALGKPVGRPPGHLSEQEFVEVFRTDSETAARLERLRRIQFQDDEPDSTSNALVLQILQDAAELFRGLAQDDTKLNLQPVTPDPERHADAYRTLSEALRGAPRLSALLRGAIAYALPHCTPVAYQLDLLLPDDVSAEGLGEAAGELVRTFGGRRAALGDVSFTASLILDGTLSHPLAYRGLPFPFLREHVQRYGKVLQGDVPNALTGRTSREDLRFACRVFLPYHMFNLRRRVEYSNGGLNFCQLAGIRLFLETGEVETDADRVRLRHRDAFIESPEPRLWEYLMQPSPSPRNHSYAAGTRMVAAEYARVHELLAESRSGAKRRPPRSD